MASETAPIWILMPILGARDYTIAAIADGLAQSIPTRLLLINQGVDDAFRDELERIAEAHPDRVGLWSHQPPLPSLAATWNRALEFVWAAGGDRALVVNNDVRLAPSTLQGLSCVLDRDAALLVSAVGTSVQDFDMDRAQLAAYSMQWPDGTAEHQISRSGGPDFSCFLISRACHVAYRFDEGFIPAFCEDLDYHRQLLLGGDGDRIFSVNLPYLHYGSATLKGMASDARQAHERAITAGSRAYYARKWGGPVNQETFLRPFGGAIGIGGPRGLTYSDQVDDGTATTPYLQAHPPQTRSDPESPLRVQLAEET